MPIQLGIDLVCVEDVEESIQDHGRRYLERIYTEAELRECGGHAGRLAASFAAKEATIKAIRPGATPIGWHSIAIRHDARGGPSVELTGAAAELAQRQRIGSPAVSVGRTRTLAAAVVVAETESNP